MFKVNDKSISMVNSVCSRVQKYLFQPIHYVISIYTQFSPCDILTVSSVVYYIRKSYYFVQLKSVLLISRVVCVFDKYQNNAQQRETKKVGKKGDDNSDYQSKPGRLPEKGT